MRSVQAGLMAAALAAGPLAASAGPHAVLYDAPSFHGRAVGFDKASRDLTAQHFAARAVSGRFEGAWILCDAPDFQGDCDKVVGAVDDLAPFGLDRRLMSLRPAGPPPALSAPLAAGPPSAPSPSAPPTEEGGYFDHGAGPPPAAAPPPAPPETAGVAGASSVFFVRPQIDGADIPGDGRDIADAFCRARNLGPALYWTGAGGSLRDVLCRKD